MEYLKVGHPFTKSDIFYGDFELVADADDDTALGGTIQFCNRQFIDIGGCHKLFCLFEGVLSSRTIQNEKHFVWCAWHDFLHHIAYS